MDASLISQGADLLSQFDFLWFPLVAAAIPVAGARPAASMHRILLAEDSPIAAKALAAALEAAGYTVRTADNGRAALALAQEWHPDLVLTDILMPELDGFGLCRQLKQHPDLHQVPVVFITSTFTGAEDRRLGLALGGARFLTKSTAPGAVVQTIAEVLAGEPGEAPAESSAPETVERLYYERLLAKLNKKIEEARASESRYHNLFARMLDGMAVHEIITDEQGKATDYRFLELNEAFERLTGLKGEAVVGHTVREVMPAIEQEWIDIYGAVALTGEPARFEQYAAPLGRYFEVLAYSPQPRQFVTVFSDVTAQKQWARSLQRLNRALRTLSQGNQALVRAASEPELLDSVCRVAVEEGGYRLAWVGYGNQGKEVALQAAYAKGKDHRATALTEVAPDFHVCPYWEQMLNRRETVVVNTDVARDACDLCAIGHHGPCSAFILLPLQVRDTLLGVLVIYGDSQDAFDHDEVELLQELAGDLAFGIDTQRIKVAHQQSGERLQQALLGTIRAIALTLEKRDPYTAGHQQRVAVLASAIAAEMGLEEEHIEGIRMGCLVHDIGKIHVPAEILSRPGRLSPVEFGIIKTHPQVGYDIIREVDFPWPVGEMILQHHERLDGSGYPGGLQGEAIVLEARILGVADVVEAMAAHRPYRPGLGIAPALEELERGRGTRYDAQVVDVCLHLFRDKGFQLPK